MPSRFEIAKTGPNTHEVRLGTPGWEKGDPKFFYRLTVEAENVENIGMEPKEWKRRVVEDGKVVISSIVWGFPGDSVRVTNISSARCQVAEGSEVPSFNVTYIDETAKEPKRKTLATTKKDYTWTPGMPLWQKIAIGAGIAGVVGLAWMKAR